MGLDDILRSALEEEAERSGLPAGLFSIVSRRARVRRALTASLIGLAIVAIPVGAIAGVNAITRDASPGRLAPGSSSVSTSPAHAVVPEIVGMFEPGAVKALAAAGLAANVQYDPLAPQTGRVLESEPPGGASVAPGSSVKLRIALEPGWDVPSVDEEERWNAQTGSLPDLVEANPQAFVGLARNHQDEGVPVVVLNPGVDPDAWRERLDAAAEGHPYRTDVCPRSHQELGRITAEIASRAWSPNARSISFAVGIHPATCTVRIQSDQLTTDDIRALGERFGTAVSVDTSEGSHPVLL
jgi:hypothetical protein